jgi:hypothetical protein
MEECDELHGAVRSQARVVPRGGTDGQGLGGTERGDASRAVGDGEGQPQRGLQDQADYMRLAKMRGRGHLRRLTVFIQHENVVGLLVFLGYRQEE